MDYTSNAPPTFQHSTFVCFVFFVAFVVNLKRN